MLKGKFSTLYKILELTVRSEISEDMKAAIKVKYERIGINLVNFNIINIMFQSSKIESAIETTQILGQKIEEMDYIKLSKQKQLEYLEQTNKIYDRVNKSIEVTKGEVSKKIAEGKGLGKAKLYENVSSSINTLKGKSMNDEQAFLFIYLGIFKNTFNSNQNVYVTKNSY
jgi:predicted DNA binding CopG/RHH family protein